MNKKTKKLLPFIIAGIALACICAYMYKGYLKYCDLHTWVTVDISGTSISDTADAYSERQKCRKGDQISVGPCTLLVTHVAMDGTLSFEVKRGELVNESGAAIQSDDLKMNEGKNYKSGNDSFSLCIVAKYIE